MALGDIQIYDEGQFGLAGSKKFSVASGTTSSIKAGEPVLKALGNATGNVVSAFVTNKPVVGSDYLAGISASTSTETSSAAGTVEVVPLDTRVTYLVSPNAASSWDTQAKYNALVGACVLLDVTNGVITILASNSTNNGCVVEPLDIAKYPGKVRFSLRAGLNYLS